MNLHILELFCSVAEFQSISKAAKHLHISQPAVSSQIQSLEQFYEIQLFFRTTKGVMLTPAGEIVYDTAKQMIQLHAQTMDKIKHCSILADQICIGVTEAIGNYILPGALNQFRYHHPNIKVNLSILKNEEIIKGMIEGAIHMGVVEEEINSIHNLESITIGSDPIVLAGSPSLSISKREQITIDELFQNLYILNTSDTMMRKKIENWIAQSSPTNNIQQRSEISSIQAIKSAVLSGYGVCFFPKSTISFELSQGLLVPFDIKKESDIPMDITYHLIYNTKNMPIASQHFLSYILQAKLFLAS